MAAFALAVSGLLPIALIQFQKNVLRSEAAEAKQQLARDPVMGMVLAIETVGQNRDRLPGNILPEVQSSLLDTVQIARERNRFQLQHPIYTAVFSPDGQKIAAAGADKNLYLWNRQGQQTVIPGTAESIRSLSFNSTGEQILGLPATGAIQQWNLQHNTVNSLKLDSPSPITVASFSSDGRAIVSGSTDGRVRLWNEQQQWIGQLSPNHTGAVTGVAFSGGTIASSATNGRISLWNRKGDLVGQLAAGSSIRSMRADQAGQRLFIEDANYLQALLWNPQNQQWQQYPLGAAPQVKLVDLSPDNAIAAQALNDGSLHLLPATPQSKFTGQTLLGHQGSANTVRFSADGKTIISGGEDGTLRFWDVFDGTLLTRFHGQEGIQTALKQIALSSNGQHMVLNDSSGKIYIRDIQKRTIAQLQINSQSNNTKIAFSANGQILATQTEIPAQGNNPAKEQIQLWKTDSQLLANFSISQSNKTQILAVDSQGKQIARITTNGKLQLWNQQGQLLGETALANASTSAQLLQFSPDGQQLIISTLDRAKSPQPTTGQATEQATGQVCLWSLRGISQISCQSIASQTARFSPDGQTIAIGSTDGKVYLWNLKTHQLTASPVLFSKSITAIAFSSDNQTIATGSSSGTVRLLNSEAQPIGQPFTGQQTLIQAVAFQQDGQAIVSLSQDGEVRLWQANWQSWLKTACDRLQSHPVFANPTTAVAKGAKSTCQRWVWSSVQTPSSTSTLPPVAETPVAETAPQTIRLVVKLSDRRVYVYRGSTIEASYPVAVGKPGWETPTGNFRVFEMLRDPGWTNPLTRNVVAPGADNPLGSRWIAFWTDGHNAAGFHGTPDQASVGQAASHGCLRLRDQDVLALYEWVELGTPVTVEP